MKRGEIIELTVESLGFEGIAIARHNGLVVHLRGGIPGERVRAKVHRTRRSYVEAEVVEILLSSPNRRQPPCPYAGECGGCSWQHIVYREQVAWKEHYVRELVERIGGVTADEYRPIIASPEEFGYRAKMEFTCSDRTWIPMQRWLSLEPTALERKRAAIGLHVRGRFDAVLDIDRCLLQDEHANTALAIIRQLVQSSGISCYNQRTRSGFLRNVVIRRTSLGERMLVLITQTPTEPSHYQFLNACRAALVERVPGLVSLIWGINDTPSPVAPGPFTVLAGRGYVLERIQGIEFRISAQSFFQANVPQLERFVNAVAELAGLSPHETAWDLYAGAGTLTLPLARHCAMIVGVESNPAATDDAKENAERNGITNARFLTADLHTKQAWTLLDAQPMPEVVVLDPPRAGVHPFLIEYLLQKLPPRLVYVSCNPATQARDLARLSPYYRVQTVQPIDMFPQTYHVESIALLIRS